MNVYGYIPGNFFPSHSTLAYWAQAASFAGLPSSECALTSTSLVLGLKKSQLPLTSTNVTHKSRSLLSSSSGEEFASLFRAAPRVTSHSGDHVSSLGHYGSSEFHSHLQHHQQQLVKQHHQIQHHHNQHHHFYSTSPPLGGGLAPLQALCEADVSTFTTKTSVSSDNVISSTEGRGSLKFGMSRILSDDFGKSRCEKENNFELTSIPESCRSLTLCPCNSRTCTSYTRSPSPYTKGTLSLSAVHALQPPTYALSSSADALPGPYSILSADNALANQTKRKRSWSRAVFSNLQRKGLEKRFEVQKYVTKPDRRQLAAMLGLTDAQVKVWFQNRRMKWRHAQQQGEKDKQTQPPEHQHGSESQNSGNLPGAENISSLVDKGGDTLTLSETSRDNCAPEHVVDSESSSVCLGKLSVPCGMQSRNDCTSPQDLSLRLYVTDCPADRRLDMTSSYDFRHQESMDITCNQKVIDVQGHELVQSPDPEVMVTILGHHVLTSQKDPKSSEDRAHELDFDSSSPADLEMDSDIDVNDSDVRMIIISKDTGH